MCVDEVKGAVHDFELFKRSEINIAEDILLVADKGYQGINSIHEFSIIPYKKPRKGELTEEQRAYNSNLSSYRIFIEHINRRIKRFKMFQHRYRNKQRKHLLRFSLVCGFHNYELGF